MRTQHSDLGNAHAKPPPMQVVEVSGVNGTGVLRAGLVLTACGLCHVFGQPLQLACTPDDDDSACDSVRPFPNVFRRSTISLWDPSVRGDSTRCCSRTAGISDA